MEVLMLNNVNCGTSYITIEAAPARPLSINKAVAFKIDRTEVQVL